MLQGLQLGIEQFDLARQGLLVRPYLGHRVGLFAFRLSDPVEVDLGRHGGPDGNHDRHGEENDHQPRPGLPCGDALFSLQFLFHG
jgi:hypothetical protein